MRFDLMKTPVSHGDGKFRIEDLKYAGKDSVFENGVLIFHPENVSVGSCVYIGHNTILKAYYKNEMKIGDGTWIGQGCYFHSAGEITIGRCVGIGPYVKILTSVHDEANTEIPVMHNPLIFSQVIIEDGTDIGIGTIILPGITIGEGAIIGAGSVVTKNIEPYTVYAGIPARCLRKRKNGF